MIPGGTRKEKVPLVYTSLKRQMMNSVINYMKQKKRRFETMKRLLNLSS